MENENQSNLAAIMAAPSNGILVSDGMAALVDCLRTCISVQDNYPEREQANDHPRAKAVPWQGLESSIR